MEKDYTLLEFLRGMKAEYEKQKSNDFPFNEREKAKAELVTSLLKRVDSGQLIA